MLYMSIMNEKLNESKIKTPNESHWPYEGGNSTFHGEIIKEIIIEKWYKKEKSPNTKK